MPDEEGWVLAQDGNGDFFVSTLQVLANAGSLGHLQLFFRRPAPSAAMLLVPPGTAADSTTKECAVGRRVYEVVEALADEAGRLTLTLRRMIFGSDACERSAVHSLVLTVGSPTFRACRADAAKLNPKDREELRNHFGSKGTAAAEIVLVIARSLLVSWGVFREKSDRSGGSSSASATTSVKVDVEDATARARRTSISAPNGLQNLGNTCYMNAALVALLHTPAFARVMADKSFAPAAKVLYGSQSVIAVARLSPYGRLIAARPSRVSSGASASSSNLSTGDAAADAAEAAARDLDAMFAGSGGAGGTYGSFNAATAPMPSPGSATAPKALSMSPGSAAVSAAAFSAVLVSLEQALRAARPGSLLARLPAALAFPRALWATRDPTIVPVVSTLARGVPRVLLETRGRALLLSLPAALSAPHTLLGLPTARAPQSRRLAGGGLEKSVYRAMQSLVWHRLSKTGIDASLLYTFKAAIARADVTFAGFGQQDAHELLAGVFTAIDDETACLGEAVATLNALWAVDGVDVLEGAALVDWLQTTDAEVRARNAAAKLASSAKRRRRERKGRDQDMSDGDAAGVAHGSLPPLPTTAHASLHTPLPAVVQLPASHVQGLTAREAALASRAAARLLQLRAQASATARRGLPTMRICDMALRASLRCARCGFFRQREEFFHDLSLDLPDDGVYSAYARWLSSLHARAVMSSSAGASVDAGTGADLRAPPAPFAPALLFHRGADDPLQVEAAVASLYAHEPPAVEGSLPRSLDDYYEAIFAGTASGGAPTGLPGAAFLSRSDCLRAYATEAQPPASVPTTGSVSATGRQGMSEASLLTPLSPTGAAATSSAVAAAASPKPTAAPSTSMYALSLLGLLRYFFRVQEVELRCEQSGCGGGIAVAQYHVSQLPRTLILHLKRFEMELLRVPSPSPSTAKAAGTRADAPPAARAYKRRNPVHFPAVLSLAPFCTPVVRLPPPQDLRASASVDDDLAVAAAEAKAAREATTKDASSAAPVPAPVPVPSPGTAAWKPAQPARGSPPPAAGAPLATRMPLQPLSPPPQPLSATAAGQAPSASRSQPQILPGSSQRAPPHAAQPVPRQPLPLVQRPHFSAIEPGFDVSSSVGYARVSPKAIDAWRTSSSLAVSTLRKNATYGRRVGFSGSIIDSKTFDRSSDAARSPGARGPGGGEGDDDDMLELASSSAANTAAIARGGGGDASTNDEGDEGTELPYLDFDEYREGNRSGGGRDAGDEETPVGGALQLPLASESQDSASASATSQATAPDVATRLLQAASTASSTTSFPALNPARDAGVDVDLFNSNSPCSAAHSAASLEASAPPPPLQQQPPLITFSNGRGFAMGVTAKQSDDFESLLDRYVDPHVSLQTHPLLTLGGRFAIVPGAPMPPAQPHRASDGTGAGARTGTGDDVEAASQDCGVGSSAASGGGVGSSKRSREPLPPPLPPPADEPPVSAPSALAGIPDICCLPPALPHTSALYELHAVVRHEGASALSGHYTTDVAAAHLVVARTAPATPPPLPEAPWVAAMRAKYARRSTPASPSLPTSRPHQQQQQQKQEQSHALARCPSAGAWHRFNDAHVSERAWADVAGADGRRVAYCLLYSLREGC